MLPYIENSPKTHRPLATLALLLANIALTSWVIIGAWDGKWELAAMLGRVGIVAGRFDPLSLLTYSFFHADFGHLLINVAYLLVFGPGVEAAVGWGRLLLLYLAGAVVGGLLQWGVTVTLLSGLGVVTPPIVGASAACAGLMGLFAARYYRARIAFVGLPFRPQVVFVVAVFLAYEIISGLVELLALSTASGGVAHWAHVGGFIFGLGCAQLLRLTDAGQRAYFEQDATLAMAKSVPGAALRRWEAVIRQEPYNFHAHSEAARAWFALGDREHAEKHWQYALLESLRQNRRPEAAQIYAELRQHDLRLPILAAEQQFVLGNALEEAEQFALAADLLRSVTMRHPDAPEAETALLKVITLYVHRLNRQEEAKILLRLFVERFPNSQWRPLADDLRRAAEARPE